MNQLVLALQEPPAPTFDNFVPGRNAEVVAALQALATRPDAERVVYLWGAPASGRTHLLAALVESARQAGLEAALVAGAAGVTLPEVTLLALDGVERLDAAGERALFNALNRARDGTARVAVSGPCPPARLRLREDVTTRLGGGLVFEVHPLSDEEKIAALEARAEERGFALPREAIQYLLARSPRDMATLFAVLDRLDQRSIERHRPVTVRLLREVLEEPMRR
ncbi:DnaA regulatory inactivator Hda [Pelomicrobium methylotrophicum]|uniref:DnaA regulatory inactivator Hda n=1 Tax=Pelomicrobium methylotrophicum TaxID=2602750 RepID=A0A5C7EJD3_9PROT|nr:DnaA regulatory inactivator Hda [Pelomicrobium methylotrophicum]TXF11455.1 DnaA regulatory inactivator Hda [Pelomicrobium methylotrophicum]